MADLEEARSKAGARAARQAVRHDHAIQPAAPLRLLPHALHDSIEQSSFGPVSPPTAATSAGRETHRPIVREPALGEYHVFRSQRSHALLKAVNHLRIGIAVGRDHGVSRAVIRRLPASRRSGRKKGETGPGVPRENDSAYTACYRLFGEGRRGVRSL